MGGLGLKNFQTWNIACVAKLLWHIESKKDALWIKWVHSKYLKGKDIWDYEAPADCSWYWKKLIRVKNRLRQNWLWSQRPYSVQQCYLQLLGTQTAPTWTSILWSRAASPRHSFIAWLSFHQRLPVLARMNRILQTPLNDACTFCSNHTETQDHLLFQCAWSKTLWSAVRQWWPYVRLPNSLDHLVSSAKNLRINRHLKNTTIAIHATIIYYIWTARNLLRHKGQRLPAETVAKQVRDHITQRILHLACYSSNYRKIVDWIL